MNDSECNVNNNFGFSRKVTKYLLIKIPHISKKITLTFRSNDTADSVISRIQESIHEYHINFGLLQKMHHNLGERFLKENEAISADLIKDCKFMYIQKHRVHYLEIPGIKKLKDINSANNQKNFLKLLIKDDVAGLMAMLEGGFDPNFLINDEPLLFHAINSNNAPIIVTALVCHGAHPDLKSLSLVTIIHKVVRADNSHLLQFFMQLGVNADSRDDKGLTPLYYCMLYNETAECLDLLLANGCSRGSQDSNGLSEIHQACFFNKLLLLERLLTTGEDIDLRCVGTDNTPLHCAVLGGATDCLRFLISRGASTTLTNQRGITACQLATLHVPGLEALFQGHAKSSEMQTQKSISSTEDCDLLEERHHHIQTKEDNDDNKLKLPDDARTKLSSNSSNTKSPPETTSSGIDGTSKKTSIASSNISTWQVQPSQAARTSASKEISPSSSTTAKQARYWGLTTRIVEFRRALRHSGDTTGPFGFSIESDIVSADLKFVPSSDKPSLHRICKWKVMSSIMSLYAKPCLLEVNSIPVSTVPHIQLVHMINNVRDYVLLTIALISNGANADDAQVPADELTSPVSSSSGVAPNSEPLGAEILEEKTNASDNLNSSILNKIDHPQSSLFRRGLISQSGTEMCTHQSGLVSQSGTGMCTHQSGLVSQSGIGMCTHQSGLVSQSGTGMCTHQSGLVSQSPKEELLSSSWCWSTPTALPGKLESPVGSNLQQPQPSGLPSPYNLPDFMPRWPNKLEAKHSDFHGKGCTIENQFPDSPHKPLFHRSRIVVPLTPSSISIGSNSSPSCSHHRMPFHKSQIHIPIL